MRWLIGFVLSSIGAKILMASTGIVLVAFLFGHMIGNLQVFAGQDTLNAYAAFLHNKPLMLWTVRGFMLACFVLHVFFSARLTLLNQQARPIGYAKQVAIKSTFTSRNMFVTGALVLAFLVFHLLHFTFRTTHPEYASLVDSDGRMDVYAMVVLGFRDPWIAGTYIVAMLLLGLHVSHAVSSIFQTLGLTSKNFFGVTERLGPIVATLLVLGNLTMPIAALVGCLSLPSGGM